MCRKAYAAAVAAAMVFQAPVAWAQLQDVDPVLHAAVEALVTNDPEVARDPELAELCRSVAEATVRDPRERAAVTREVVELYREGMDVKAIVPREVREAARTQFTEWQGRAQAELETLRAANPELARERELFLREGERAMRAFETGERYAPSREMIAHAETMMRDWEADAVARGAPPEFVERARGEFARWSSAEMNPAEMMAAMGPGHEMMGPGGPGEMPSLEQMEQMVAAGQMSPEQLQMAKEYMQHGGFEHFGPGPGAFEAYAPAGAFEAYHMGMEAYHMGMEAYHMGMEAYHTAFEAYTTEFQTQLHEYQSEQLLNQQQLTSEHYETAIHVHEDTTEHSHTIHVHTDGTRHDHTATSPADVAPNAVFQ